MASRLEFSDYQGDILAIAIGKRCAHQINEGFPFYVEKRYGVKLSDKSEATIPFEKYVCAIGASYTFSDIHNLQCAPSPMSIQKYFNMIDQLESSFGRLIPKEEMREVAGLHTLIARFSCNGTHASNTVYALLQLGTRTDQDMKIISHDSIRDRRNIESTLLSDPYPEITQEVRFWHPGVLIFLQMQAHLLTIVT